MARRAVAWMFFALPKSLALRHAPHLNSGWRERSTGELRPIEKACLNSAPKRDRELHSLNRGLPFIIAEPIAAFAAMATACAGKNFEASRALFRGWLLSPNLRTRRLAIGPGCTFFGKKRIEFGDSVTFYGNAYVNAEGDRGFVRIGRNTHVDQFCTLYGQGGLSIGADCAIAAGVCIYTQTNQYEADALSKIVDQPVVYKAVTIGDDVWIGAGAIILPGVKVGDHAVIGAGALVREDVSAWAIVGGLPAKVLGDRRPKLHSIDRKLNA